MNNIVVIGGSAGSFKLVGEIISGLPASYPGTIILCLHRLRSARVGFLEVLSANSKINIKEPSDKEKIRSSAAYLAPANYHLLVEYGYRFALSVDRPVNHSRPSIDVAMKTIAEIFREKAVGILLSGANMDGAAGMMSIYRNGGTTVVQNPDEAEIRTMPASAINLFRPDHLLNSDKIKDLIWNLT